MSKARNLFAMAVMTSALAGAQGMARADLAAAFDGFDPNMTVNEVGTSGLVSSYSADTGAGNLLPDYLPTLGGTMGTQLVNYPDWVGQVPSPGYNAPYVARNFDEGILGVKVDGSNLVVQVAETLNTQKGYYYSGWATWFGQGDMFLTVQDSASGTGVHQYALLDAWARDSHGNPRTLGGGYFDAAAAFHVSGGAGGTSLEGHLIALNSGDDVVAFGGTGAYAPGDPDAPVGLDYRAFAVGGTDLGDADLTFATTDDVGLGGSVLPWYVQTWTVPFGLLSADKSFTVALHTAPSCGNDQIAGVFTVTDPPNPVPVPASILLGCLGLVATLSAAWRLRRSTRSAPGNS